MIRAGKLQDMQKKVAREVRLSDGFEEVKLIAAFDTAFVKDQVVCGAVVVNAETMEVVEKKHSVTRAPMNYIPGLLAFREGPPILQTYYDIENDPDILMIKGHGIAHPLKCGLATYVGVELAKPTIGMAKGKLVGEVKDDNILIDGEVVGKLVKTKEHANALFVSPGHMVSVETAADWVKKTVIHPHKLPEPLHIAHKYTKHIAKKVQEELKNKPKEEEQEEQDFQEIKITE